MKQLARISFQQVFLVAVGLLLHPKWLLLWRSLFTEAAAINWRLLSAEDQAKVISLYFDGPEKGGHGYTVGRGPINSCDFSPASYTFDVVVGDVELTHFDTTVKQRTVSIPTLCV